MLVLAGPADRDRREDGFTYTIARELLYRPMGCDAGEAADCGCERSWVGMVTRASTTLAEVIELYTLDRDEYIDIMASFFVEDWGWPRDVAETEAHELADIAEYFGLSEVLTIDPTGINQLEVGHE